MGDPGGVGPEVIVKALQEFSLDDSCFLLLIGSQAVFEYALEQCHLTLPLNPVPTLEKSMLRTDSFNVLDVSDEADVLYRKVGKKPRPQNEVFDIGQVSLLNATLAFTSLKVAAYQAACGLVDGLVTAPVNKEAIRLVEPHFSGHTDYLAKVARADEYAMLFYSDFFCVTLATIHLPLKQVSGQLNSADIASKIMLTDEFLRQRLEIHAPRIAVAALNPHGSEFGDEEKSVILPAVQLAKKKGIRVSGPLPGDQVFHEAYEKRVDAVIAMYHDQGLAPFKMVAFDTGVNVTLGLSYVRTSPDHGTAFDIAYQGKANPRSFLESLRLTRRLVRKA